MIEVSLKKKLDACNIDVRFSTEHTRVTALFGPSGSGKTSAVNMVAGLLTPDDGVIRINETTVFDSDQKINIKPEKRRTGYVFQDGRLFPHLTVKQNLLYGRKKGPKQKPGLFDDVVDLLGINLLLSRRPSRLSGGEKQRVAIGRALLSSPEVLIMDEPFASLDEARKNDILPFVRLMCRTFQIPALYVSHSREEILKIADTVVVVKNGFGRPVSLSDFKS